MKEIKKFITNYFIWRVYNIVVVKLQVNSETSKKGADRHSQFKEMVISKIQEDRLLISNGVSEFQLTSSEFLIEFLNIN